MSRPVAPVPYVVASPPSIPGADDVYLANQLRDIAASIASIRVMTPQVSTVAPKALFDGMVRLARNPWRPVAGQVADAWVYYDGAGSVWRYSSTAPTST